MRTVGWLLDDPGYLGGAEFTARDLRAGAPDGVEIIDCPPGAVQRGLDLYVVHNCMSYSPSDAPEGKTVRFVHDERGPGPIDSEHRVFYSPSQRKHVGLAGELCPAPLDRERFTPNGSARDGAVNIGTFGHFGKGQQLLREYSDRHGPLDVYGAGPCLPQGPRLNLLGPIAHDQVPAVLRRYRTFVHLPSRIESYGRGVAEAWATGCEIVANRNVGCLWWLENDPDALDTATERFWSLALNV